MNLESEGVLFEVSDSDLPVLDKAEGAGQDYRHVREDVCT